MFTWTDVAIISALSALVGGSVALLFERERVAQTPLKVRADFKLRGKDLVAVARTEAYREARTA